MVEYATSLSMQINTSEKQRIDKLPEIHNERKRYETYRGVRIGKLSRADLEAALCQACRMYDDLFAERRQS